MRNGAVCPTGIDIRKVVELGILPRINTGIAHRDAVSANSGQVQIDPDVERVDPVELDLGHAAPYVTWATFETVNVAFTGDSPGRYSTRPPWSSAMRRDR